MAWALLKFRVLMNSQMAPATAKKTGGRRLYGVKV
jgi:hypothetical protein